MKFSQLHTRTIKEAREYDSVNATLLTQAGFIDQVMAGVYAFLPLGLRVLNKIETIVREEMDKIGTEISMPSLSPMTLWQQSGRLETIDVLMKTTGANEISKRKSTKEYILNATHEEIVTPIAKKFNASYKDFPFAFYQIQTKFRNEARAKSGLLRGREFRMKDLYSFHTSEEELMDYYQKAKEAYMAVYRRLGIGDDTYIVQASGGAFTDNYSHEFQVKCETGEDQVFLDPVSKVAFNQEIAPSRAPVFDQAGEQPQPLHKTLTKGITGMQALVEFLQVDPRRCVKTLIYQTSNGQLIAAAVRGDYDISDEKLRHATGATSLSLASETVVREATGAETGYAGLIGLPDSVKVFVDDSLQGIINFECGANETDYHFTNVNWGRDLPEPETYHDLKVVKPGDISPESNQPYEVFVGSEVGNIFPLGTKYSQAFDFTFADQNGKEQLVQMGCYGIGITRLMGVLVEKFHDEKGIIWPESVAPFRVHLISLRGAEAQAQQLYQNLAQQGVEVLWDEREVSPGIKFADADLIGIPIRLVVSERTSGQVEWKQRNSDTSELLSVEDTLSRLQR
jgi:prolyl-tRNA synthetase